MKKKRKYLSALLALTMAIGIFAGKPVAVRAEDTEPLVAFAGDNSDVILSINLVEGNRTYTHTFTPAEKALIDTWNDVAYTYIFHSDYSRGQTDGLYRLVIYPKSAELRVFAEHSYSNTYLSGQVFDKTTNNSLSYVFIDVTDYAMDGRIDDATSNVIEPDANPRSYSLKRSVTWTIEEYKEFVTPNMYSTATVKTYDPDSLEVGDVFFKATSVTDSNNEYQGSTNDSQAVQINCALSSIYSVSLPAQIELGYDILSNVYVGSDATDITVSAEGYFGIIKYGACGKIGPSECVYIEPQFPCTLSGASGSTVTLKKILDSNKTEPQTEWNSDNIGSCDFDGTTLTNCNYTYNDGLQVGFLLTDILVNENYSGNLVFNFGIRAN